MTVLDKQDVELMINICYQSLRSTGLNQQQITDINSVLTKLYDAKCNSKGSDICSGKKLSLGRKKKATKQTELR
jgi:hypothetical protein